MSFNGIIGHDRAIAILKRALDNGMLAHAYLFAGEPGIGKRTTALALAATLNCAAPGPDGGCGNCPSCRRVAAGSHPDVHLLEPEGSEIKIDQVRQTQADLSLKAFEGARKVLIIDDAADMNPAAANAFLKTLEEPPGESLIVLVTARPQSLLDTIRSRCQVVAFQPLPRTILAAVLRERRGLEEEDAWFLAALSRGSVGRALEMDAAEEKRTREEFATVRERLATMRPDEIQAMAEGIAKDREGFEQLIDKGIEWLRDLVVLRETGNAQLLVYGGGIERMRESARRSALPVLLRDLDRFVQCRQMLERRASAQLVAEHLFLSLARA